MVTYLLYFVVGIIIALFVFFGWGSLKRNQQSNYSQKTPHYTQVENPQELSLQREAVHEKGRQLMYKADFDKALEKYKEVEVLIGMKDGKSLNAVTLLMKDVIEYGNFQKVSHWCEDYFEKNPHDKNPIALFHLSDIYSHIGEHEKAMIIMREILNDKNAENYLDIQIPLIDAATYCIQEAAFHPSDAKEKILEEAAGYHQRYADKFGEDSFLLKSKAEWYLVNNDYENALETYKAAINKKPKTLKRMSDGPEHDERFGVVETGHGIKFGAVESSFVIAILNMWAGNKEDAKDYLEQGLSLYDILDETDSNRFAVWREFLKLGDEIYLGGEKVTLADIETIDQEIKNLEEKGFYQEPFFSNVRDELKSFIINRDKENYKAAIENLQNINSAFESKILTCPAYYIAQYYVLSTLEIQMGDLYLQMGETDKAKEAYIKAGNFAPKDHLPKERLKIM